MDRLDRQGGFFLEWASAPFGDGERHGSGELPEDSSSSAGRSTSSGAATSLPLRVGKEGTEGEVPAAARPGWLPTAFADAHFLLATGSPVRAIRPFAWPDPLVLLPFPCARGGADVRGLGSLDW